MCNIIPYIEQDLKLKVNQTKTEVAHISKVKFLGYGFYFRDGRCRLRVHPKSQAKMKERVRELTCRSNGKSDAWRKDACNRFVYGWVNYFKLANMETMLGRIDQWFRRRLRQVIWKRWKRVRTRFKNLIKLGLSKTQSWMFANTRKGYWRTANRPIMATSITNERLERAGYVFFSSYYANVRPKCN